MVFDFSVQVPKYTQIHMKFNCKFKAVVVVDAQMFFTSSVLLTNSPTSKRTGSDISCCVSVCALHRAAPRSRPTETGRTNQDSSESTRFTSSSCPSNIRLNVTGGDPRSERQLMLAIRLESLEKTVNDNEGAEMCSENQKTDGKSIQFWSRIFIFSENKWTGLDWMVKVLVEINLKYNFFYIYK